MEKFDCIVVGGGAAGFFAAIHAANGGKNKVAILEKTTKLLSKVKVSGGGRCNVTHAIKNVKALTLCYPRGGKKLQKAFSKFAVADTMQWFEKRGVTLKTEQDGRVFPESNQSQTIIDALQDEATAMGITTLLKAEVLDIQKNKNGYSISTTDRKFECTSLILATGGSAKQTFYKLYQNIGFQVVPTIPSLFTFNVKNSPAKDLMGVSVSNGSVRIPGTSWKQEGPILITHWGFSAPAVILLSAWAAVDLHAKSYQFPIEINWVNKNEEAARNILDGFKLQNRLKLVKNQNPFELPSRLWSYLLNRAEISEQQQWHDLAKKNYNKLIKHLTGDDYPVNGKTTFKEEFVSCGGIHLDELNLSTFESKKYPNLFAVGELVDVDGITGGFNFQHAWTSGYLAGSTVAQNLLR